jgi:hypothetical protein
VEAFSADAALPPDRVHGFSLYLQSLGSLNSLRNELKDQRLSSRVQIHRYQVVEMEQRRDWNVSCPSRVSPIPWQMTAMARQSRSSKNLVEKEAA